MLNREQAWQLLNEYSQNPSLLKHALAVEAAMRWHAERDGHPVETWGVVGLLHDFDYERWPSFPDHPTQGAAILRARGCPEEVVHAIQAHVPDTGLPRETPLDRTLFAVDELCGFITAVALVRPSKALADVTVESVRKKLKDKRFAAGVSRHDIDLGAAELGVDLERHIGNLLAALQPIAAELGLAGVNRDAAG